MTTDTAAEHTKKFRRKRWNNYLEYRERDYFELFCENELGVSDAPNMGPTSSPVPSL